MENDSCELIRGWVTAACREWSYPDVPERYFEDVYARIPSGVRILVTKGHQDGLIVPVGGYRFSLQGLPSGKGPYAWVSRNEQARAPGINWEYLIQAAEYVRVYRSMAHQGYLVLVEDRLMDITVSTSDGVLQWYIEVKVRAADVPRLVDQIAALGLQGVELDSLDRGNDALRKAKYLTRYRPAYLSVCAIGIRRDFHVVYGVGNRFTLVEDMVPLM
jgi:hypothetical protein